MRLKDSARDRMEKHPNIFAINLMKEIKTMLKKKENYLKTYVLIAL